MKRILSLALTMMLVLSIMMTGLLSTSASAATDEYYTITYHLDGGTNALKNPSAYTSEDTITLADATKEGYDFAGWFLDPEKTQQITKISGSGNVDVYAKFIAKSYAATFNGNGAEECGYKVTLRNDKTGEEKYVYLNSGDSFSPHEYWKPEADGYVYAGWMYQSNVLSDTLKINSDIELVPKWISNPKNYPVLGDTTTKLGVGLYYNDMYYDGKRGMSQPFYVSYDYEECSFEYAVYTYVYEGEQVTCSSCGIDGTSVYYSCPYKSYAYNYYGLDGKVGEGKFASKPDRLYTAEVSAWGDTTQFPLNYVLIGVEPLKKRQNVGEIEVNNVVEFGSNLNVPSAYKSGYAFLGWYDSQGNQMTDTWQYTKNQTFTAKWELLNYDITYELDGGVNNASNPAVYTIEDTITLKDPIKPGYTFKGWYSDADFTTQVTSISNETGNITLYAKWEVNSYNLTLDANEGSIAPKVTFISDGVEVKSCYLDEQDTITAYRPDNKEGYIFAGWYKNATCTSLFKFNGTIEDDITLYAKWMKCDSAIITPETLNSFDVTIQGKTERLYAFVPLADGQIKVSSASDNLDLFGILYDASKNIIVSSDDISSSDLDFSYSYEVKAGQLYYIAVKGNTSLTSGEATIKIVWNGGCAITGSTYPNRQMTVVYDTAYELPQKPAREGYVFLGWFDETDTQITDGMWNFVTDKTLTAKWEEATYHTVTFKDVNGEVISSKTYYLSEDIVAPDLPTKAPDETYIYYAKWDNDYTGVCTGDAVYSPIFEATYIDYTVVFVDEDGTELSRKTYHYGDEVTAPAAPSKDADNTYTYTFAGWNQAVVNCAGDATYTATYTPVYIDYTVVFKDWNGDVISSKTYHWGDKVVVPANPVRSDEEYFTYTFAGWDQEVVSCAGDVVYTATYDAKHIHKYTQVVTLPTCTEQGFTTNRCPHCGDSYEDNYQEALGHAFGEWTEYTASTCTKDGVERRKCANCDHYESQVIKATGHSLGDWQVYISVTCTKDGQERKQCANCDYYESQVIKAAGHDYENAYCTVCGEQDPERGCGANVIWTLDDAGTLTISGTGDMKNYTYYTSVPWYSNRSSVKTVVIEDGVTSIGSSAFYKCTSLTSVTIPDSVTSIGNQAFYECSSLTSVTIGDSVTSIGNQAFYECSSLTSVTIGDSVTSIGISAFYWCTSLTDVYITDPSAWCKISFGDYSAYPMYYGNCLHILDADGQEVTQLVLDDSVTVIPNYAFLGSVLTSVTIPDSVTSIGASAFSRCDGLTSMTISDNVISIGSSAFYKCTNLASVTIPDSVTSIGNYAFYSCTSLTSVTIPDSVTRIGDEVLYDCTSLTSVTIPDSVTRIGNRAFYNCKSLTGVTIPNSVTSIGNNAFGGCSSLIDLYITDPSAWCKISFGKYSSNPMSHYGTCLHILDENGQEVTQVVLDESVTVIPNHAFGGSVLTSVTIPDSVTSIGGYAFSRCSSLTSVTIGDRVTSIGDNAFDYCSSLTSVTIPDSVTSIDEEVFRGCSSLTSVTIPDSVTSIGSYAFSSCRSLTSVTIPDSVTSIGENMLSYCYNLDHVFYRGTPEQWSCIDIALENDYLLAATRHCNMEGYTAVGCTVKGIYCSICEKTLVAGSEHNYEVTGVAATCTEDGEEHKQCVNCDHYEFRVLEATGHSLSQWEVYTPVTCTEDGEERKQCANCDYYESQVVEATGHSLGQWEVYTEPTCTQNGEERKQCANCDYYETQEIDPMGHDYDNGLCSRCGKDENAIYNGLVVVDGVWGYYEGGVLQEDYTGLVPYGDILFYVENGILDFTYTGLVWHLDAWRYVANSQLTEGYTGLVWFNDNWFYTVDSVIDWTFTGLVPYEGNYFYVQNNLLDWSYTGLGYHDGSWYFIQNGLLQKQYSGLVYFNDNWFYVEEGVLTYQYFGMVEYQGNMFYVQASHLDWNYTGLGFHEGNWYYFQNALYMPDYNGLVLFNGSTFYVEDGLLTWTTNGLHEHEGKLYYIKNSEFDATFNGTAEYEGVTYEVVDGVVEL